MTALTADSRNTRAAAPALLVALVVARFVLPLITLDTAWGIHRDEFLYFAMADHFDLLRMQFPPLIAMVAASGRAVFGESVLAARVPAALGGAALTGVVLFTVRRLGGGTLAVVLAWLSLLASPLYLRASVLMQPVIFELVFAALAIAALTLAAHEHDPRWWLAVGVGLGLGAMNKFSIVFVGLSIAAVTILNAELRAQLRTRWPWCAVLIGAILSVPGVTGQIVHGWPFLQQMQALRASQLERVTPVAFAAGQLTMMSGALLCVIPGVVVAFRGTARERVPAIVAFVIVALMLTLHGKPYYAGAAYPLVIAAGALALERNSIRWPAIRFAAPAVLTLVTALLWPIGVPSLTPVSMVRYAAALGIAETVKTNQGVTLQLPQDFADLLGWTELADSVGAIVARLPAAERADLTLVGGNYGQAGALAFYRKRARLPYAISTRGDFWAWGPGTASGEHAIVVGDSLAAIGLARLFTQVDVLQVLRNAQRVPEEQSVVIYHARGAHVPIATIWASLGPHWD